MESSEKEAVQSTKGYNIFILDRYLITYPIGFEVEIYNEKWYYGIIFKTAEGRYDVLHNYALGNRLIINKKDGSWNDIPFKPATFDFLPEGVKTIEIG